MLNVNIFHKTRDGDVVDTHTDVPDECAAGYKALQDRGHRLFSWLILGEEDVTLAVGVVDAEGNTVDREVKSGEKAIDILPHANATLQTLILRQAMNQG